jgi:cobalt-zinc-cadmium efflux system protein
VALLISTGAIPLLRQSLSILLEQAPSHLDSDQIQAYLEAQAGVAQVKSLRVWTLAPGQTALMAALTVESNDGVKRDRLLRQLKTSLQAEFGIQEIVLELSASTALTLATLPAAKILEFIETSEER